MGRPRKNPLEGKQFGKLTVVSHIYSGVYNCVCECGNTSKVGTADLTGGRIEMCWTCGVVARSKHGHHPRRNRTAEYMTWASMKQRCLNPNHRHWEHYGGRGITVCERWMEFTNFLEDMGERPARTSIDRIDNNGNYEPGNCKWATKSEQRKNQRKKAEIRAYRQFKNDGLLSIARTLPACI